MSRPAIHPGEILADELAALQISAAACASILGLPYDHIAQLLAGERSVTADTASRLGKWFGTGPELWDNLQAAYDRRAA